MDIFTCGADWGFVGWALEPTRSHRLHNAVSTKERASRIQSERRHKLGNMFSSWRKKWHVFVVISV